MKAVLLIGGEATRLRPLTCNTPKAMVPVLNMPFLEHVIRHLSRHGVKDLILTQGPTSMSLENFFGDGSRYGVKLSYTVEATPLGTAGAVKNAEKFLDDTFLVLNGDVFTSLDVGEMVALHHRNKAKATIALTPVEDPTSYGVVETDARGRVLRFIEKPGRDSVTGNMINAGTYVLEPDVLALAPPNTKFSFERELFPTLLAQDKPVYAYPSSAYWMDIGTPERYLQVHRDLLKGKDEVLIGEGSQVHPRAQVRGPAVIGPRCSIAEGAVVENSVVWWGVKIGRHARVIGSVVANDCHLGHDSVMEGAVIGDKVKVAAGCRVAPGAKIWPGTAVAV